MSRRRIEQACRRGAGKLFCQQITRVLHRETGRLRCVKNGRYGRRRQRGAGSLRQGCPTREKRQVDGRFRGWWLILGICDVDHGIAIAVARDADRAIAGQRQGQPIQVPHVPQPVVGNQIIDAGQVKCRAVGGEGDVNLAPVAGDLPLPIFPDAGDQTSKASMVPGLHRHALCRRDTRRTKQKKRRYDRAPYHAAACLSPFRACSRSLKLGRIWDGVFWRPTSMQILVAWL